MFLLPFEGLLSANVSKGIKNVQPDRFYVSPKFVPGVLRTLRGVNGVLAGDGGGFAKLKESVSAQLERRNQIGGHFYADQLGKGGKGLRAAAANLHGIGKGKEELVGRELLQIAERNPKGGKRRNGLFVAS